MKRVIFWLLGLTFIVSACQDDDSVPFFPQVILYVLMPPGAPPGTAIDVVGSNFSMIPEENIVTVGGRPAEVLSVSEPQLDSAVGLLQTLRLRISEDAALAETDLIVARSGYRTDTTRIIVSDRPLAMIEDINPKEGPPESIVVVYGTNFNTDRETYTIIYEDATKGFFVPETETGQIRNTLVQAYPDSLLIQIPDGFQQGRIRITTKTSGQPTGIRYELRSPEFTVLY